MFLIYFIQKYLKTSIRTSEAEKAGKIRASRLSEKKGCSYKKKKVWFHFLIFLVKIPPRNHISRNFNFVTNLRSDRWIVRSTDWQTDTPCFTDGKNVSKNSLVIMLQNLNYPILNALDSYRIAALKKITSLGGNHVLDVADWALASVIFWRKQESCGYQRDFLPK